VSANEVPDYHEDIHTYLREMEVKALWIQFVYCTYNIYGEMKLRE
jgi:hypothetical protein